MCSINKIWKCLLLLVFAANPTTAQYKLEQPVHIRKEQGLPSNDIRSIRKGVDGFLWLATSEGLCRFDGQQFKVYQEGNDLTHSLFENSVNAVLPLKGRVWAGTNQGISVLNTKDQTFRHYQLQEEGKINAPPSRRHDQFVAVLYQDKKGKIWIGSRVKGVFCYDEATDNFRHFDFSREQYPQLVPAVASDHSVICFEESEKNDSIIWAGTPAGLQEINKYTGKVKLITFPQKSKDYQVALNAFRRLHHHDDGLLYVSSWAAGVNVYDPETGTFTPLQVKNSEGLEILRSTIGNLFRKSDHEIWITTGAGLAVYDTDLQDITWTRFNKPQQNEYYGISHIDDAGRIWHSDISGLMYFDPVMQQFTKHSFKHLTKVDWGFAFHVLADKTGDHITVCPRMTDGIFHYNRKRNTWTKSSFSQNFQLEKDAVRGFAQLPSGDYIISADRAVFVYSQKQQKLVAMRDGLPVSPTRRGELLLARSGYLWLSDDSKGLVRWKPGDKTYKIYNNGLSSIDSSHFFNRLVHLYEDSKGNIWFERIGGYAVYVAAADSVVSFMYEQDPKKGFPSAHSFAEDRKGRVWISGGDGLLGYALASDPARGAVHKMMIREKGFSGFFPILAADPNGDVWTFNKRELVRINTDDLTFTRFSFQYGVSEADFYSFSFLPSGEMIFGGRNDITIANPAELKRNAELPEPYILGMEVMNRPFDFKGGNAVQRLGQRQNFFSILFSAKAYTMAGEVRFRYRLKGFDDWTEAGKRRFANYTNVPGGDYVFELQAANNEGLWNDNIIALPIHVATPWWLTWWFRTGTLLLIGALVWWFYRYRISQVRKKEQLKSRYEKKLANVEMTALLAQMNPHFLFNSLNSIDSYIIKNESKKASEYLNNFARLMRLILQNSRSNYISLKDELETLELYIQMEGLRFRDKFQYEILVDKEIDTSSVVIPPMLIQPYVENAIWHGLMHKDNGTAGKVEVIVSKRDNSLMCVVQDNGIGREKAQELKAQRSGNQKRSMGMQITMDRVEMINKLYNTSTSISITDLKDKEGNAKGTRVELVIPV